MRFSPEFGDEHSIDPFIRTRRAGFPGPWAKLPGKGLIGSYPAYLIPRGWRAPGDPIPMSTHLAGH